MGTNMGWSIRRSAMHTLKSLRWSSLADEISRGRPNGVFLLTSWLLHLVSRELCGNYYLYAKAGAFPQKSDGDGFSRRALRNRINWADEQAIETLRPHLIVSNDPTLPENASVDKEQRPWDIPVVAWDNKANIPRKWRELAEFHEEDFYRLDWNFATLLLPELIAQGKLLREAMNGHTDLEACMQQPTDLWSRLRTVLTKQHTETRKPYQNALNRLDIALAGPLKDEAEAAYLIFSLTDFRQEKHQFESAYIKLAREEIKPQNGNTKRQEIRHFT